MTTVHCYAVTCSWEGSTGPGYDAYPRTHAGSAPPALATLRLSADKAFRGDPDLLNPEQLFVLAASSCQLLSFLAVAARARLDVRRYQDRAEAEMPEDAPPVRIAQNRLKPPGSSWPRVPARSGSGGWWSRRTVSATSPTARGPRSRWSRRLVV